MKIENKGINKLRNNKFSFLKRKKNKKIKKIKRGVGGTIVRGQSEPTLRFCTVPPNTSNNKQSEYTILALRETPVKDQD